MTIIEVPGGGAGGAAADPYKGFMDYNDSATTTTPINLAANTWTTLTNDGLGAFTNKTYKPSNVTELLDVATGYITPNDMPLGRSLIIRNDYVVTPSTNNQLLEFRYELGTGAGTYTLENIVAKLDSGSAIPYRFSLFPTFVYLGDTNTRDNPIKIQIRTSGTGTVVNNGSVIQTI